MVTIWRKEVQTLNMQMLYLPVMWWVGSIMAKEVLDLEKRGSSDGRFETHAPLINGEVQPIIEWGMNLYGISCIASNRPLTSRINV